MCLVRGQPFEERPASLLPPRIFRLPTQPMKPRNHPTSSSLRHPEVRLFLCLAGVPPSRPARIVGADHIRNCAPIHHRPRHAPLLRTRPYWCFSRSALVVGIEPCGNFAQPLHVLHSPDAAAQVANINGVGRFLLCSVMPKLPDLRYAIHINVAVLSVNSTADIRRFRRCAPSLLAIDLLAVCAVAHVETFGARPAIRIKSIRSIELVDFAIDCRHLLGKVGAEHAGLIKPGTLAMTPRGTVRIECKPFRVSIECFFIRIIAIHSRDYAKIPLARGSYHFSKQIP